jgi:hypothetical protein
MRQCEQCLPRKQFFRFGSTRGSRFDLSVRLLRPLRDAELLWTRSGRLLIAERLRLTTARLTSVRAQELVLSNSSWPARIDSADAENVEKTLCLWLNSTLGVLSFVAARVDTEGAWVKFKKPVLNGINVLDPRALSAPQRKALARFFDEVSLHTLDRFPAIATDKVRVAIDEQLARILGGQTDLGALRQAFAREPILV